MATYKSDRAQTGVQARFIESGTVTEYAEYTGSATLSAGDVIQMVKVQAGARVTRIAYVGNVLDATTGTILVTVGDGLDVDRYDASVSLGTTVLFGLDSAGLFTDYEYTADDTIDIKFADVGSSPTAVPIVRMIVDFRYDKESPFVTAS